MGVQDDVGRLTAVVVRDLALSGRARQLRQQTGTPLSVLAKAAGATPDAVGLWEAGAASPTCSQALGWLSALYERASWREAASGE